MGIAVVVALILLVWWMRPTIGKLSINSITDNTSHEPYVGGDPIVRQDAWERESQGIGDYRKVDTDHFDVDPTPISKVNGLPEGSEYIYHPDGWTDWGKEFIGPDISKCAAWFNFYNSGKWLGPYDQNHLPEFTNPPAINWNYPIPKWRVATNCTLRYFQRG